jgi:hypothetical protein
MPAPPGNGSRSAFGSFPFHLSQRHRMSRACCGDAAKCLDLSSPLRAREEFVESCVPCEGHALPLRGASSQSWVSQSAFGLRDAGVD